MIWYILSIGVFLIGIIFSFIKRNSKKLFEYFLSSITIIFIGFLITVMICSFISFTEDDLINTKTFTLQPIKNAEYVDIEKTKDSTYCWYLIQNDSLPDKPEKKNINLVEIHSLEKNKAPYLEIRNYKKDTFAINLFFFIPVYKYTIPYICSRRQNKI